jgi:hypothetical protein
MRIYQRDIRRIINCAPKNSVKIHKAVTKMKTNGGFSDKSRLY